MSELVRYERKGRTVELVMNRPEKRNALNGSLVGALSKALDRAANEEGVRVVVLSGEGHVFSAGADLAALQALQTATPLENAADSEQLMTLFRQIFLHPKPIIARLHGHAIAGGCGLAVVCDFAVAAEPAKLGFTEVRIGFVPAIVMVFVLRKIGEAAARDLLLRGRLITAAEAARLGLITRAVAPAALDNTVDALAEELATETSGSAVTLTKQMIARVPGMGLDEALAFAVQMNAFARGTDDCQAGIAAFLEKTDPPWRRQDV